MTDLQKPIYQESDLAKSETNLLNLAQLKLMLAPTPADHIYTRPAKGGGRWSYVTGTYVKKKLNIMFGWNWDFEIMDEMIREGQAIVKGRLTCRSNGQAIIKTQYGRQDLKYRKQTEQQIKLHEEPKMLDLGNDLKGASTDALKKCAAELGIASDVYAPNEYKSIQITEDIVEGVLPELVPDSKEWKHAVQGLVNGTTINQIETRFSMSEDNRQKLLDEALKHTA